MQTIDPNKPVLCAAAPSDKKTSLCDTTTAFLTESKRAPTYIRQHQVFAAAGCFKEIKTTIAQFKRGSYTSDEVDWIMQMDTKSKKKLCKLSKSERDAVLTSNDTTNRCSYAFQIRACGQLEQVEPGQKFKKKNLTKTTASVQTMYLLQPPAPANSGIYHEARPNRMVRKTMPASVYGQQ